MTPLPRSFYARPVLQVAREALGKVLVVVAPDGSLCAGRIVETEAYRGPEDLAAHSRRGAKTARNRVMWGPAGFAYVFFVYGQHWHVNLVTGAAGEPHAVLIRALEPLVGLAAMSERRGRAATDPNLCNGPGKLCRALGIGPEHRDLDLCGPVLFVSDGPRLPATRSPRIGVDYAGEWAERKWRFFHRASRWVSRAR